MINNDLPDVGNVSRKQLCGVNKKRRDIVCRKVQKGVPGTHFAKEFFISIQIRWKIYMTVISFLAMISLPIFAHATTAQLPCHVHVMEMISSLEFGWEQNEISITFESWWKIREWNVSHVPIFARIDTPRWFNSFRAGDAYMHKLSRSSAFCPTEPNHNLIIS